MLKCIKLQEPRKPWKVLTIVRVPDKIRNSLLHVQFQSSAQSPDLFGPFATSRNVSGSLWRSLHILRYWRIFPRVTKFYFTCRVQNALSCCTLIKSTTFHSISLSSVLILSLYLNLCFEHVTLRQAFLPKPCKHLLCPFFLLCLPIPSSFI
jgi:hypothetical protein